MLQNNIRSLVGISCSSITKLSKRKRCLRLKSASVANLGAAWSCLRAFHRYNGVLPDSPKNATKLVVVLDWACLTSNCLTQGLFACHQLTNTLIRPNIHVRSQIRLANHLRKSLLCTCSCAWKSAKNLKSAYSPKLLYKVSQVTSLWSTFRTLPGPLPVIYPLASPTSDPGSKV